MVKKRKFNKGKQMEIREKWRLERKNNKQLHMKNAKAIKDNFCKSFISHLLYIVERCISIHVVMNNYHLNLKEYNELLITDLEFGEYCDYEYCTFKINIFPTMKFGINLKPTCTKGIHWKAEYYLFAEFEELIDKFKPSAVLYSKYPTDELYEFIKDVCYQLKDENAYIEEFAKSIELNCMDSEYDFEAKTSKEIYESYLKIKQRKSLT